MQTMKIPVSNDQIAESVPSLGKENASNLVKSHSQKSIYDRAKHNEKRQSLHTQALSLIQFPIIPARPSLG